MLLYNARIVTPEAIVPGYVTVEAGVITAVSGGSPDAALIAGGDAVDCDGDLLMPGAIDTHVHFREPGLTDKADIAGESRAAVAGGVTSYCDMPNTRPATVTAAALEAKMRRAAEVSAANYSFFIGATDDNLDELSAVDYTRCPGIKVFMGSSTGNMLMDDDSVLHAIVARVGTGVPLAFHAEDNAIVSAATAEWRERAGAGERVPMSAHEMMRPREACVAAARRVHDLAQATGARCVLLHVTTADELAMSRLPNLFIETCPHYLLFDNECYDDLGAAIKCNPAIKGADDCDMLLRALDNGDIDLISTDHAPHLPADKEGDVFHAASGMPGVQFSLPLMLTLTGDPVLTARLMAAGPARVYGIRGRGRLESGCHADIVRVRHEPWIISDDTVLSRCGWTPYNAAVADYRVVTTWVNGIKVYDCGKLCDTAGAAQPLLFDHRPGA